MPEYKEIDGITYRVVTSKYNGIRLSGCLIPENQYKELKEEKTALKKKSRTPRKQIEKLLDDAWSAKVKENANYVCEKCRSTSNQLNSHHIFSRSHKTTRWDLNNGICLCVTCHTFGNNSAHLDPKSFMEWLIDKKGKSFIDKLEWRSQARGSFSVGELEFMYQRLIK